MKWLLLLVLALPCAAAGVQLEWDANPETNVVGYRVYHGQLSRQYFSTNSTTNTTFALTNLVNGTNFFAVTAFDTDGLESEFSEEVFLVWTNRPSKVQGVRVRVLLVQSAPSVSGPWGQGMELTQLETAFGTQFYRLAWGEPVPPPVPVALVMAKSFLSAPSPKSPKLIAVKVSRAVPPVPMPPPP